MAKKLSIFDQVRAELSKIGVVLVSLPGEYGVCLKNQTARDMLVYEELPITVEEGLRIATEAKDRAMAEVERKLMSIIHGSNDDTNF